MRDYVFIAKFLFFESIMFNVSVITFSLGRYATMQVYSTPNHSNIGETKTTFIYAPAFSFHRNRKITLFSLHLKTEN